MSEYTSMIHMADRKIHRLENYRREFNEYADGVQELENRMSSRFRALKNEYEEMKDGKWEQIADMLIDRNIDINSIESKHSSKLFNNKNDSKITRTKEIWVKSSDINTILVFPFPEEILNEFAVMIGAGTQYVQALIPQYVKNGTIILAYEFLRRYTNKITYEIILQNATFNTTELSTNATYIQNNSTTGSFIENQGQWGSILFGESNMAYSGCGIIATYNALVELGEYTSPSVMVDLISTYEKDGAAVNGKVGVAPTAIYNYFNNQFFDVNFTDTKNPETINKIGVDYDVIIVTVYNDEHDITEQMHTVCITREKDGEYVLHNVFFKDGNGVFAEKRTQTDTLEKAISQITGNSTAISVIGINKRISEYGDFPSTINHI